MSNHLFIKPNPIESVVCTALIARNSTYNNEKYCQAGISFHSTSITDAVKNAVTYHEKYTGKMLNAVFNTLAEIPMTGMTCHGITAYVAKPRYVARPKGFASTTRNDTSSSK